jgi:hypothetical protein
MKTLVSLLVCQGVIQFFVTKAENDIDKKKKKEKQETVLMFLRFRQKVTSGDDI